MKLRFNMRPYVNFLRNGNGNSGLTRNISLIFDGVYYISQLKSRSIDADVDPIHHFVSIGWRMDLNPCYLFDVKYYLFMNPDVKAADMNPLEHFVASGYHEGRKPHPLFDPRWYSAAYPEIHEKMDNPLSHYLHHGWNKNLKPNPLFDSNFYLEKNDDVRRAGAIPLRHYLEYGSREGRRPNPFFDPAYYRKQNPDVDSADIEPLSHYIDSGWREGRNPSADLSVYEYWVQLEAQSEPIQEPIHHYLASGITRAFRPVPVAQTLLPSQLSGDQYDVSQAIYQPPTDLIPWFKPLNIRLDRALDDLPTLNILVPGLGMKHMSGGPNTALNIGYRLARNGVRVRFVSTDAPVDDDPEPFWSHVSAISGISKRLNNAELVDASDRTKQLAVGTNDMFLATAWWTAQMAKYITASLPIKEFFYLIQDYEPILHANSSQSVLAEETYGLNIIPIINSKLLAEFLVAKKVGFFANEKNIDNLLVFEPAIDRGNFYHQPRKSDKKTLLFYARPSNGLRNLFEIGVAALQKVIFDGTLNVDEWRFVGMGESFSPVPLGRGAVLEPAPWLDFHGYAEQMRSADILLSLMLSPHPSYPPLEMAACGKPVVTSCYENKDARTLSAISECIIGVSPTIEGVAEGIVQAARHSPSGGQLALPISWDDSLSEVINSLEEKLLEKFQPPKLLIKRRDPEAESSSFPGYNFWPRNGYDVTRRRRLLGRLNKYKTGDISDISLVTSVWNTSVEFLDELYQSVIMQDSGLGFRWEILDNGSTNKETVRFLDKLDDNDYIRLHRVPKNLGIVGGMRYLLSKVNTKYFCPLDSDDILTPDCIRIISSYIRDNNNPEIMYSDEDKILNGVFRDCYEKPDWDPVLFHVSCFIAHFTCINTNVARDIGCYSDDEVEGSHDWDTFTRFSNAGISPIHIPETIYTWRMHELSTAGNINSKSFINSSQISVLKRFVAGRVKKSDEIEIGKSSLFGNTPDWRLLPRRSVSDLCALQVAWLVDSHGMICDANSGSRLSSQRLLEAVSCLADDAFVHFKLQDAVITDDSWENEALAQFELFPDAAAIGGRVLSEGIVVRGAGYFSYDKCFGYPDEGRNQLDPGYFAQAFKQHSTDFIPLDHAVFKVSALRQALRLLPPLEFSAEAFSVWVGLALSKLRLRMIYSPFFCVVSDNVYSSSLAEQSAFKMLLDNSIVQSRYLPRGVDTRIAGRMSSVTQERRSLLDADMLKVGNLDYEEQHWAELLARTPLLGYSRSLRAGITVGLLTSVYIKTDPGLFALTAKSVIDQSLACNEWVILKNGPISEDVARVIADIKTRVPVREIEVASNVGIIGAMRLCLEAATTDWVVPLDADDLLTYDALEVLAEYVCDDVGLVYSDEDIITVKGLQSPIRRGAFDPILNDNDSYIWHLCIFNRTLALALDVYSSKAAEFCHDWDTVMRFSAAGEVISHCPHVLYHWRHHAASTSGSGETSSGSLESVKNILQKVIDRQSLPELYEVSEYPLNRGAVQYGIIRKHINPATFCLGKALSLDNNPLSGVVGVPFVLGGDEWDYWIGLGSDVCTLSEESLFEAMKLFEMHPAIDICTGRVINSKGMICSSGIGAAVGAMKNDAGPMAMYLKPQMADQLSVPLFAVRKRALPKDVLQYDEVCSFVKGAVKSNSLIMAYSPLFQADAK